MNLPLLKTVSSRLIAGWISIFILSVWIVHPIVHPVHISGKCADHSKEVKTKEFEIIVPQCGHSHCSHVQQEANHQEPVEHSSENHESEHTQSSICVICLLTDQIEFESGVDVLLNQVIKTSSLGNNYNFTYKQIIPASNASRAPPTII